MPPRLGVAVAVLVGFGLTPRPSTMAMLARNGNPVLSDGNLRAALVYIRRAFGALATMEKRSK